MTKESILIVEDEPPVAHGLIYGLRDQGFAVLWAQTAQAALEMARRENPSLILLDVRLPDGSGFDVCRQLRVEGKRQPIIMLTARDDEVDKVVGLELGADDYVVKPYSLRELISRVRALLRRAYGELAQSSATNVVEFGDIHIDFDKLQVTRKGELVELTPTEYRLLRYLVSHPDRPCSRDELIQSVWGYEGDINSDRTVDVHIRHLRLKLEDDPASPATFLTVRGVGYKFQP